MLNLAESIKIKNYTLSNNFKKKINLHFSWGGNIYGLRYLSGVCLPISLQTHRHLSPSQFFPALDLLLCLSIDISAISSLLILNLNPFAFAYRFICSLIATHPQFQSFSITSNEFELLFGFEWNVGDFLFESLTRASLSCLPIDISADSSPLIPHLNPFPPPRMRMLAARQTNPPLVAWAKP